LQQFDTPLNIYERPANRFVAEFVGSPSMNFIEGRIDVGARSFAGDGISLRLDESQLSGLNGREQITLGIRPEHIQVSATEQLGWLKAPVYVTELMGNETFVFLRSGKDYRASRRRLSCRDRDQRLAAIRYSK